MSEARKAANDEAMENLSIQKIYRSTRGNLVIQLPRKGDHGETIKEAILKGTEGEFEIKTNIPLKTIQIKDLYEGLTKAEVAHNVAKSCRLQSAEQVTVHRIRPAYGGMYACTAQVPWTSAVNEVLKNGKMTIGLVRCRVHESKIATECYRCLDYGHIARNCQAQDRSNTCLKCGKAGHKIAECKNNACCILCTSAGRKADLQIESSKCEALKKALKSKNGG